MSGENHSRKCDECVRDVGFSAKMLELIILPTEKCNFRCKYCYEDFKIGRMNIRTVNAIKTLIANRAADLELLKIDFFGGEPFAAQDIIFAICEHANALSREYGFHFYASASTNGYFLSPNIVRDLRKFGLSEYQITLDGDKEVHDLYRVRANGGGTFDRIWNNLIALRETDIDFKIWLRVHLQPRTIASIRSLLQRIDAEFGQDRRFVVVFKALAHLGSKNDKMFDVFKTEDPQYLEIVSKLKTLVPRSSLLGMGGADSYDLCYASRANSFVIRADGRVGKCTVALDDDRNVIGILADDGRLIINNKKMAPWIRGLWSLDAKELACPLMNFPGGEQRGGVTG